MNLALPKKKVTSVFCIWHRLVPRAANSKNSHIPGQQNHFSNPVIAMMIIIAAHVNVRVSIRH